MPIDLKIAPRRDAKRIWAPSAPNFHPQGAPTPHSARPPTRVYAPAHVRASLKILNTKINVYY